MRKTKIMFKKRLRRVTKWKMPRLWMSGKFVAENAVNVFMENLKYVRDLSSDEDCELKFPSL